LQIRAVGVSRAITEGVVPGGPEGPAGRGAEVRTMVRSDGVVFRFSRIFLTCEVEGRWIPGFFFTDESLF
jgi:hypothetical protein